MSSFARTFFAAIVLLSGVSMVWTHSDARADVAFIRVGLPTLVPFGWADFCHRYQSECASKPLPPEDIAASKENLALLDRINRAVNASIKPLSDLEHWRAADRWDLPDDGFGDCEDYALLKRKLLVAAGMPRQSLLVTVVRDEVGDGHAVLTVKTTRGEFILDNMNDHVKLWSQTPYHYVKRQSQEDQNVWVAIGDRQGPTIMVAR